MGSHGYQPQPQVWPQDPRLRRQISTLDVRQLDTRRARIAFILITSSCMTAWRWRAFSSSASMRRLFLDRSTDLFPRILYIQGAIVPFSFSFTRAWNPTIGYHGVSTCLGPTSRHVRNFALDNLWRERKPSTCVYIRLPGICWNPAGSIVCIWWILGKSLPRLRLRAAFFSLCALCNKEGKCLREKHFVDRACAEINKCKRRILCVLFSFSFFR